MYQPGNDMFSDRKTPDELKGGSKTGHAIILAIPSTLSSNHGGVQLIVNNRYIGYTLENYYCYERRGSCGKTRCNHPIIY